MVVSDSPLGSQCGSGSTLFRRVGVDSLRSLPTHPLVQEVRTTWLRLKD